MAIIVSTKGVVRLNTAATSGLSGADFSDHCRQFVLNDGQETRDVSVHGDVVRHFRAGIGLLRADLTFRGDAASGQINQYLTNLITTTTSGAVTLYMRKDSSNQGGSNPGYQFVGVLDGDFSVLSEEHGEVQEIQVGFACFSGGLEIISTTSS